jgi:hypothetical protein
MKQVITSSDLHFIFFLELSQRILMDVLHEHGMVVPHFHGVHSKLA